MIHLITITGKSARNFFLEQQCISNFKSLIRAITSGRTMIISTKFRSDVFYTGMKNSNNSILKLWALYADTSLSCLNRKDCTTSKGDQQSLSGYFLSINKLSENWCNYGLYKKAFNHAFNNDQQNPVARTIVQCDLHLVGHPNIKRSPLVSFTGKNNSELSDDTFSLAMHILNNQTHSN
ncbi:hypothetical protein [Reichenbachiella sp. MALMAid0571]|uniref:hypothetical protein n=1 Tax=Reichenbachiella sp. MALMAid0571 TaxID=3143939 RepID=UPI0032DF509A